MLLELTRRFDSEQRLTEFLVWCDVAKVQLDWEVFNCASFGAKWIEVQTDYDMYSAFRGKIHDEGSAYKEIRKLGYENLDDIITSQLPEIPIGMAQRGDLVLVPADGERFLGLGMSHAIGGVDPPFFWALGTEGLGRGHLYECTRAFAVGAR